MQTASPAVGAEGCSGLTKGQILPVIPALRRHRQQEPEFQTDLGYTCIVRLSAGIRGASSSSEGKELASVRTEPRAPKPQKHASDSITPTEYGSGRQERPQKFVAQCVSYKV